MSTVSFISSSIGKKVAMSLSAFFLISFLLLHVAINLLSVVSSEMYNEASHFMGTNPIIQFVMQPILIFGVLFHFTMGFVLEFQNKSARPIKYEMKNERRNSSWLSRNMIYSGLVILAFLGLHFYDFWLPEMKLKYIEFQASDEDRYFDELVRKFEDPMRVGFYAISFVLLMMHLLHGFQSAFQSLGVNNKFTPSIKKIAWAFSVVVPLAFVFIALFHHFNH
jgi:succinate dehydrogenase / fumarate reductase cytochrome b subunit